MGQQFYSADQVASLLGLHVKTVRGYLRGGQLRATRVGKQYRISQEDLEAFTASPAPAPGRTTRRSESSCIVQVDAISPEATIRLTNTVLAVVQGRHGRDGHDGGRLRVESAYDEERASLKVVILGDLGPTADLLKVIDTLLEQPG